MRTINGATLRSPPEILQLGYHGNTLHARTQSVATHGLPSSGMAYLASFGKVSRKFWGDYHRTMRDWCHESYAEAQGEKHSLLSRSKSAIVANVCAPVPKATPAQYNSWVPNTSNSTVHGWHPTYGVSHPRGVRPPNRWRRWRGKFVWRWRGNFP